MIKQHVKPLMDGKFVTQTRWQAQKQGCIEGDKSTYVERQTVNQGQWNGISWCDAGDTGGPIRTFCECNVCGHHWKPRKVKSIHDLVNLDIVETAQDVKFPNR